MERRQHANTLLARPRHDPVEPGPLALTALWLEPRPGHAHPQRAGVPVTHPLVVLDPELALGDDAVEGAADRFRCRDRQREPGCQKRDPRPHHYEPEARRRQTTRASAPPSASTRTIGRKRPIPESEPDARSATTSPIPEPSSAAGDRLVAVTRATVGLTAAARVRLASEIRGLGAVRTFLKQFVFGPRRKRRARVGRRARGATGIVAVRSRDVEDVLLPRRGAVPARQGHARQSEEREHGQRNRQGSSHGSSYDPGLGKLTAHVSSATLASYLVTS